MKKKILVSTGGGDCPGLNAVIRGIVKSAIETGEYEVWGSIEAFNGVLAEPQKLILLDDDAVSGIHVKGGTILRTTNRGNPLAFPVKGENGEWTTVDRTAELKENIESGGFDAVINIGGDGSQKISLALYEKGVNIVGVPKTIDNDLYATDRTFGFATAVEIATESFDRLVTTAESHNRVMIMEVMGRDAGWIALHTAIAGGAEICLLPEIPYDVEQVLARVNSRYEDGTGFANIVIAEGAKAVAGKVTGAKAADAGDEHIKLGGVANVLRHQLEQAGCEGQIRSTILGHVQRGGVPCAFDRILATSMGVRAFQMVARGDYGQMVSYRNHSISQVQLAEAVSKYNHVETDHYLIQTARAMGISFGD